MNVIFQLPDSIANQIAAGEVVQRPSSVVKELLENSVDAGASAITVAIHDSGKTMIQVFDNGCGMTDIDARMAFERHATSKIRSSADLFKINTLGFRGEALASIAAISNVTLKTRHKGSEFGVQIEISGSAVRSQETIQCQQGTNITVKNLFFNVPARRKFLKSDQTEFRHITDEFIRVALINPHISFTLTHNNQTVFSLSQANFKRRIIGIMGRTYDENLINIESNTSLVKIYGFIGNPRLSKKVTGDQYFFANNRYMRHPFFHKAIMNAYEKIVPAGSYPSYFIVLQVDTGSIDVNIHPTKTEIKFENEREIFQLLHASVKESLGKFNFVPPIDFENQPEIEIPITRLNDSRPIKIPQVRYTPGYNPFNNTPPTRQSAQWHRADTKLNNDWQKLLRDFENQGAQTTNNEKLIEFPDESNPTEVRTFLQIKRRFILTTIKSGILLIDQHRAHFQIIFEDINSKTLLGKIPSQTMMYPQEVELTPRQNLIIEEILPELHDLGFEIEKTPQGNYLISATPILLPISTVNIFFETLTETVQNTGKDIDTELKIKVLQDMAKLSAVQYGKLLNIEEMAHITDKLFACKSFNYTVDGLPIIRTITMNEINERFNA